MCKEGRKYVDSGNVGKAMRWLGFLQGILWDRGYFSLNELRKHSVLGGEGVRSEDRPVAESEVAKWVVCSLKSGILEPVLECFLDRPMSGEDVLLVLHGYGLVDDLMTASVAGWPSGEVAVMSGDEILYVLRRVLR